MKKLLYIRSKKGEMGIGTMILFIAMVLVAAVAAALLISTAGSLNQQAQETSRLAQADVSTGFVIEESLGVVSSNTVTDLFMKIRLIAGSQAVDLENVVIELMDSDTEDTVSFTDWVDEADGSEAYQASASAFAVEQPSAGQTSGSGDDGSFPSGKLRDPNGYYDDSTGANVPIVSQGTLIMVHIDLSNTVGAQSAQDTLYIKIIPKHGAPTYEEIHIPEVIYGTYITLS